MSIKLIAADLDGTLMFTDHVTVTERTKNTLKRAHEKGIKLAIATGRPLCLVDFVTEQIPFVDYVITSNGASVFDFRKKELVYSNHIPNSLALEVCGYFRDEPVFFEVFIDGQAYYQTDKEAYFDYDGFPSEFLDKAQETMKTCDSIIDAVGDSDVELIAFYFVNPELLERYEDKLREFGLCVTNSFPGNIDAASPTANKGSALDGMCRELDISPENAMAFGDAGNDVTMLRFARYSFAMRNATQECIDAARYVTDSNACDGLAKAVENYCLNI